MTFQAVRLYLQIASIIILGVVMTACGGPHSKLRGKNRLKEYFSEAQYGVKASPRVMFHRNRTTSRSGGKLGKPYQVKGKWYYPREEAGYVRIGKASWYGAAFHGRLTANGEVYDMNRLSAAHPTMPLPSYARVTNLTNGNSVIVRVNDRGPYVRGRIIDLSHRAARLLNYQHHGTANVKVEYIGRAPLLASGKDTFLYASFHKGSAPTNSQANPLMIAFDGPTPTTSSRLQVSAKTEAPLATVPLATNNAMRSTLPSPPVELAMADRTTHGTSLPEIGPILTEKPANLAGMTWTMNQEKESPTFTEYANKRITQASLSKSFSLQKSE